MKQKEKRVFCADFETVVQEDVENQESTEVWSAAWGELWKQDVNVVGNIDDFMTSIYKYSEGKKDIVVYFHNLKFDGEFILSYLIDNSDWQVGLESDDNGLHMKHKSELKNKEFVYMISSMGQWYSITLRLNDNLIEIRDSLKLLPFALSVLGESFNTKHQKLEMEYVGDRYANCPITDEEMEYIKNDIHVLRECIELMYSEGHDSLTIGSCCMKEYKKLVGYWDYKENFPDLEQIEIDETIYGAKNAYEYILKSYKGAWCYLKEGEECKIQKNGLTADVNSLYPSQMDGSSWNYYPRGKPKFFEKEIPEHINKGHKYYFVTFKCRFYLKEGMLPTVQIKHSYLYKSNEWLKTSDVYDKNTGKYYKKWKDLDGNIHDSMVELTMTGVDFELFLKHYNVEDLEILHGCWFWSEKGMFDSYIRHYMNIKEHATGALRGIAKLFLNNLYGKFATKNDSSFKFATKGIDDILHYSTEEEHEKKTGYIPVGSAITSYARRFTINAAQANYEYFIYADTDSIHCKCKRKDLKDVKIHKSHMNCWKIEMEWKEAKFIRQKTYAEKDKKKGNWLFKCAGMPQRCKDLLNASITGKEFNCKTKSEKEFLKTKRTIDDFDYGLEVTGKLTPKRIKGGIVLCPTVFTMKQ